MPSNNDYSHLIVPHTVKSVWVKHHTVERVEVRLRPFLTSAEDTLSVHWERCSWYERSCKEEKFLLVPIFHIVSVAQLTECRFCTCWITSWAGRSARLMVVKRYFLNFHSCTVHIDIIKFFLFHQRMRYIFV